jgi:hypothetical protein
MKKPTIKGIKSKLKGKKKPTLEVRLRKRLRFLEDLEKKISADMETAKPSELAELRAEHETLLTLIAEFRAILKG